MDKVKLYEERFIVVKGHEDFSIVNEYCQLGFVEHTHYKIESKTDYIYVLRKYNRIIIEEEII